MNRSGLAPRSEMSGVPRVCGDEPRQRVARQFHTFVMWSSNSGHGYRVLCRQAFHRHGRAMLVGAVKPDSIVIMGQVMQHIRLGFLLRLVAFFGYPFRL